MKKLILAISLVAMLACLFTLAVFAEEITVTEIKSATYGTVYQLSCDPGLDEADKYVSTLNNINDSGTEQESLSILTDGTYYYVFPTSYIINEFLSGGEKGKFEYYVGTDTKPGINQALAEWSAAEGVVLPTFVQSGSLGNTRIDQLVRIEFSKDVLFFDSRHCLIRSTGLVEARMHDSIINKNVSGSIFYGCAALEAITLSAAFTEITGSMFNGCTSLTEISNWDSVKANIKALGSECFYNCSSLTGIDISSVTSIGNKAFQGCSSITSVGTLNSALAYIPNDCFNGCIALTSINIPESATRIGGYSFNGCSSLETVTVESGKLTEVGASAFSGCKALTAINLPDTVTTFGGSAFYGCSSLTEFDVPDSLVSMGGKCFQNCSGITRLEFPPTTTSFPQDCFHACTNLEYINVPRDCTYIGNYTFNGCGKVVIDLSGAEKLESTGQNNSFGLTTSLVFPEGFKSLHSINSSHIKTLIFPNSTTSIGVIKCSSLTEFVVPEGITAMNDKFFDYCSSLKKVTIPRGVLTVDTTGNGAFFGTSKSNLKDIIFTGSPDAEALAQIKTALPNATVTFANHCDVYYASAHIETSERIIFANADGTEGQKFLSYANVCVDCTRCLETKVIKSVDPLFTNKGWSFDEENLDALTQSFTVNRSVLDFYKENFGITDFGIVGAVNTHLDKDGAEITNSNGALLTLGDEGLITNDGAISASFYGTDFEIFKLKVTGLTGDNAKAKIFISAFVVADGEINYLSNGKASVGVAADSTSVEALLPDEE